MDKKIIALCLIAVLTSSFSFSAESVAQNGATGFASYEDYKKQRADLKNKDGFTLSEMEQFNNIGAVPLYRAEGITTDASGNGWEKYRPFIMTLDRVNYVDYMNIGNDINGEIKCCSDDENFYVHATINDDKFYPLAGSDNYWKGDGVQLTFSQNNIFGVEIGAAWNPDENIGKAYSVYISGEKLDSVKVTIDAKDGQQIYDIVVPWNSVFENGKPDRFQFNMCFNDNDDGINRHDCMEIEPGILIGKWAEGCPVLVPVDDENDWFAWSEATTEVNQGEEAKGKIFLANLDSKNKAFKIESDDCKIDEYVTVKKGEVLVYEYTYPADKAGIYDYSITYGSGKKNFTDSYKVTVSYPVAQLKEAEELLSDVKKWRSELFELYSKVEKMGYSAPYEYANVYTVGLFPDRIAQDISLDLFYRISYWRNSLSKLYSETKAELEKIISGEKVPMSAPVYGGGDYTIKGTTIYADMIADGEIQNRPAFFWGGVAHYPLVDNCIEDMPNLCGNCVVLEYTLGTAIKDGSAASFWHNAWVSGGAVTTAVRTTEEAYEGEASFKLSMENEASDRRYRHLRRIQYHLKPNSEYTFRFYGKANNVGKLIWGINNETDNTISGTSDWTLYQTDFVTGNMETTVQIDFLMMDKSDGFYIDNIEIVEKETMKNMIGSNAGTFELAPVESAEYEKNGYYVNSTPFDTEKLEMCEKNNLSVGLLLSTAHNLPQFIYDTFPETWLRSNGFNTSSFGNDKYRELVEKYLRYIMETVKEYECVNYIDLANEVQMNSWSNSGYYLPRFRKWLENKYGTVSAMNRAIGTNYESFSEVNWPSGWNVEEPLVTEYDEYNDWELANYHKFCADIIHEYVPDMPVWTKIMSYTADYGDIHDYSYYNNGTGLDAYADVLNVNGCDAYNYLDWDKGRLVKNQWYDYMVGTNYAPVFNGEDHIIKDSSANYDENQAFWCANDLWQGAVHYRGQTDLWLWDSREAEGITKGSFKCRPDVISEIAKTGLDMNRLSYEIEALQKEKRRVGILYSDMSGLMNTSYPGCQYYAYEATVYSGQKVNYISEKNVERIHDTNVLILAQISHIKPESLTEIKKFIENGGKVVVIGKDSLKKDWYHRNSNHDIVEFIMKNAKVVDAESDRFKKGLTHGTVEEIYTAVNDAIGEAELQDVIVVDAKTNEETYDVEYTWTVYDNKLIVNISNWGDEDKRLKVLVNGREVTGFTELRSKEKVDGDIVAKFVQPLLLSTDLESGFLDMAGHWAEYDVSLLRQKGIVNGVSERKYAPEKEVTRAEFIALITRITETAGEYPQQFTDEIITRDEMAEIAVKALESKIGEIEANGAEFTDAEAIENKTAVKKASGLGILCGYDDGAFHPQDGLTRAEAASVIRRCLENMN